MNFMVFAVGKPHLESRSIVFTIEEILDLAIKIEKNGEAVYRMAIGKLGNPSLASLLAWMADEEVRHARWFENFKNDVLQNRHLSREVESTQGPLNALLEGQTFSLGDVDFSSIETVQDLLKVSIEFERDTILFYEMLRPFIQDEHTRAQLDKIIEEEYHHVSKLKDFMENPVGVGADLD